MPRAIRKFLLHSTLLLLGAAGTVPLALPAGAQESWTGIGAIAGTVMYMDTTTIVRAGSLRKVWIRSVDSEPKTVVAGTDTLSFDTVIALNVFDCAHATRGVESVRYFLGGNSVLDLPDARSSPAALRPRSFFKAIYDDLCRAAP